MGRGESMGRFGVLLAAVALAGCTEPASRPAADARFSALIDADTEVRSKVVDVEARVELRTTPSAGWLVRATRHFDTNVDRVWPLIFMTDPEPKSSDGSYQLIATARDSRGAVVAQARVIMRYADARADGLRVHFETTCLGRTELCSAGLTCSAGDCVSAEYDASSPGKTASRSDSTTTLDAGTPGVPSDAGIADENQPCSVDGERACTGFGSSMPLRCTDALWQRQPECTETQRCDTSEGSTRGTCRAVDRICTGQQPAVPFCDAEKMYVCNADLLGAERRLCAENERCSPDETGSVHCTCRAGFVKKDETCVEATSCATANGGCDPLTMCIPTQGARVCGGCPSGWSGNGDVGCIPSLGDLTLSSGQLTPAFDSSVSAYRVRVPLLTQRVTLSAIAPTRARLAFNGTAVRSEEPWTSPVLSLGETAVDVLVSSEFGVGKTYRVVVERVGVEEAYITAGNQAVPLNFGYSVKTSDDTMLICAPKDGSGSTGVNGDPNGSSVEAAGSAFVFVRSGSAWKQEAYLKASTVNRVDHFCASGAISGDTIAVGAIRENVANFADLPTRPGSAFVFTRTAGVWTQQAELNASDARAGDVFGGGMALDGNTLVVGALGSTIANRSGSAYVWKRTGENWTEVQKLTASVPEDLSVFGSAIDVSGDTIVIAAQDDDSVAYHAGSVYVFTRAGDRWSELQRLVLEPAIDRAGFGFSLDLNGDTLAVGAPRVETNTNSAYPGDVRIYTRTDDRWAQSAIVTGPPPPSSDGFGSGVALGDDLLLVGAHTESGSARGLSGDPAMRGAPGAGAAYLYARTADGWKLSTYIKASNATAGDRFGWSVALTQDSAVVGAVFKSNSASSPSSGTRGDAPPGAGAVFVFR
jgi:hypothetical protein